MAARWLVLAAVAGATSGCSLLEAKVGEEQDVCPGYASGYTSSGGGGGSNPYVSTSSSGATPNTSVCLADAGSACDDCESVWCCTERAACYGDPVCRCADWNLDQCQGNDGDSGSAWAACWSAFGTRGTVEAERLACLQAWCASACGTP
jgi:hypothetical protein